MTLLISITYYQTQVYINFRLDTALKIKFFQKKHLTVKHQSRFMRLSIKLSITEGSAKVETSPKSL